MKRLLWLMLIALIAITVFGVIQTRREPGHLYARTGTFAGCPSRPSCVSSVASGDVHRVAALGYSGDPYLAHSLLRELIQRMGGRLVHERPDYLHAVFVTPRMRYHDDLELLITPEGRIEVRSVSRFGYHDMGTNRARVEELRRSFEAMP